MQIVISAVFQTYSLKAELNSFTEGFKVKILHKIGLSTSFSKYFHAISSERIRIRIITWNFAIHNSQSMLTEVLWCYIVDRRISDILILVYLAHFLFHILNVREGLIGVNQKTSPNPFLGTSYTWIHQTSPEYLRIHKVVFLIVIS